jgi:phage major head subunit gpT-like protein
MDINRENLVGMQRSYNVYWQRGLEWKPPVDVSFLVSEFPSATSGNFYAFLDLLKGFREWVGDRVFNNLASQAYQIINRAWEMSHKMKRDHLDDDTYGVYVSAGQQWAAAWQRLKYELVLAVLTGNPVCYTGVPFFSTNHPYGEDNLLSNLTNSPLSQAAFDAAIAASSQWVYANGKPIAPRWTHLVFGPSNRVVAHSIVASEKIPIALNAAGAIVPPAAGPVVAASFLDNPDFEMCERVQMPELAGPYANYWFLVDGAEDLRAIARQVRREPVPFMDTDPAWIMTEGIVRFMADGRAAAGPAFPHMIYAGIC